jgi:hypothetical protein
MRDPKFYKHLIRRESKIVPWWTFSEQISMHLVSGAMVIAQILCVLAIWTYTGDGFNRIPSGVPGRVWPPNGGPWTRFRRVHFPATYTPDAADGDTPQRVRSLTLQELFGSRQVRSSTEMPSYYVEYI